jgi:hypothetical protein
MDSKEHKKVDIPSKPSAGATESKDKHAQLKKHPRKGRARPPSHEVEDATETKPHAKVRTQQLGKNYKGHTN